MEGEIINRVSNSGLTQLDLEEWYPKGDRLGFNIEKYLFKGLILKELDFRAALKELDWSIYKGVFVAVHCSADAIVPTWAYMLVSQYLSPFAAKVLFCDPSQIDSYLYSEILSKIDVEEFRDKRVIVKGCSKFPVPVSAYVEVSALLTPLVQSLMFGEPCSNVPLYKKKKINSAVV